MSEETTTYFKDPLDVRGKIIKWRGHKYIIMSDIHHCGSYVSPLGGSKEFISAKALRVGEQVTRAGINAYVFSWVFGDGKFTPDWTMPVKVIQVPACHVY